MHRIHAVFPIVCAFVCGFRLPDLLWAIDTHAEVRTATDLSLWIVVPVTGIAALVGAWKAWRSAAPQQPG